MKNQPFPAGVRVFVNGIEPPGVERARPPDDAMYFVTLGQKQLCQVRSILPRDAGY